MSTAIQVENLSKSYLISHQAREPYRTMRDAVSKGAANFVRALTRRDRMETREEFWALRDVSFKIDHGERIGIIGRNGAGKSTLLKILSRITEPTKGRITISGRVASLLEVGTGFHPELTGRENIFLNGAVLGMSRSEVRKKFDAIVDFAEVERFLDTPVKRYSSGMYVRLAFAIAAHLDPDILVVDEVLAVGDAQFQKKCLGKMEEAEGSGRTVLFVSHNLPIVLRLCPRSLLLEGGRLAMADETGRVVQRYLESKAPANRHPLALREFSRGPGLGDRLRVVGCAVVDSQGNSTEKLLFGEPFAIRVNAEAYEGVADVCLSVGIETPEEVRAATIMSEESGALFDFSRGEARSILATPRNFVLKPGKYFITLAANQRRIALDRVGQALSFEVDRIPWRDSSPASEATGIVHVMAEWD